jgi:hypothetical protein
VKGAITFKFDCEDDAQALVYWREMIEASRPATCVAVREVVIQLRNDEKPLEDAEP